MAEQDVRNTLNYTNLTFEGIREKMDSVIRQNPKFSNLVDSAVYKVLLDNFAAMTDLVNYYIERTAEESFLDTAQHQSSVIVGAKQIGYVPKRPIGASANLSFTLSDPAGTHVFVEGEKFRINAKTDTVSFNGVNFVFFSNYTYTITEADAITLNGGGRIEIDGAIPNEAYLDPGFSSLPIEEQNKRVVPIKIMQGDRKTLTFYPGVLGGKKFQAYKVDDPGFSNFYGSEDNYDPDPKWTENGLVMEGDPAMFTRVFVVDSGNETEYHVNRRSLYAEEWTNKALETFADNDQDPEKIPVCLITTNRDTTVEIVFGDDGLVKLGPVAGQSVRLEYLTTTGSESNMYGVVGSVVELNATSNFETIGAVIDFPGQIEVKLNSNVLGGSDMEDMEEIRNNAPAMFQALERLVTKKDYASFVRTITSPIDVRYSAAWGEAEECQRQNRTAIYGLVNCALVTALGSPYWKDANGNWQVADLEKDDDLDRIFVEGNVWEDFKATAYFDLFLKNSSVDYENYVYSEVDIPPENARRVKEFIGQIDKHSQVTIKNLYVPPTVHMFEITGDIAIAKYSDMADVKTRLLNALYRNFNANFNFNKPIYISDVQKIIQSIPETRHSSIRLSPVASNIPSGQTMITDYLFASGSPAENPSEAQLVDDVKTETQKVWNRYVKSALGAHDCFWKVSRRNNMNTKLRTDNTATGGSNEQVPQGGPGNETLQDIWSKPGSQGYSFEKWDDGTGFDWRNYIYSNAFQVTGNRAYTTFHPYKLDEYLSKGFSQYAYMKNFLATLYTELLSNTATSAYFNNPEDFNHFIKTTCELMERTFCYSMLDKNGNIANWSMDNEFVLLQLNTDIVRYEE